jgi:hypothetical protein
VVDPRLNKGDRSDPMPDGLGRKLSFIPIWNKRAIRNSLDVQANDCFVFHRFNSVQCCKLKTVRALVQLSTSLSGRRKSAVVNRIEACTPEKNATRSSDSETHAVMSKSVAV